MSKKNEWIATADHGRDGGPGSQYTDRFAGIRRAKNGQYEVYVRSAHGSNQGYLEEHGRVERRYRSDKLDDLLRISISEIRSDDGFEPEVRAQLCAAIRDAIYETQDIESEDKS